MNGVQTTDTNFIDDSARPGSALSGTPRYLAMGLMHPDEVASDSRLTAAEKRELLASWASDARAVPSAPALRQLDNGAIVRIDDILRTLKSLDGKENSKQSLPDLFRLFPGPRIRFPSRLRSALRRSWSDDDDDDPPPCPAMIMRPMGGPWSGGESADPSLMLAA